MTDWRHQFTRSTAVIVKVKYVEKVLIRVFYCPSCFEVDLSQFFPRRVNQSSSKSSTWRHSKSSQITFGRVTPTAPPLAIGLLYLVTVIIRVSYGTGIPAGQVEICAGQV